MKPRILIIEDEPAVSSYLSAFLAREGCQVQTAVCAQEGTARVEEEPYDLVLLDLMLPDGGGEEVLREIKELSPKLPVLIVTSIHPSDRRVVHCLKNGAAGCVSKTATVDRLLSEVRRALAQAGAGN